MTVPDPTYITVAEVKANTLVTALSSLEDADITKLIQVAEGQIDAFVGRQPHHRYDSNIDRVFPREQDFSVAFVSGVRYQYPETPEVPFPVSMATLRQVEWLYTQWWPNRATSAPPTNHAIESQQIGGDGSYSETRANGGANLNDASLCDQAKILLNGFVSRWAPIGTTDVRTSPAPLDGIF